MKIYEELGRSGKVKKVVLKILKWKREAEKAVWNRFRKITCDWED